MDFIFVHLLDFLLERYNFNSACELQQLTERCDFGPKHKTASIPETQEKKCIEENRKPEEFDIL